jgi:hypothetical protein
MLQPQGSIVEICYVVADMAAAVRRWTETMRAGPFFVGDMRFDQGHRYRGAPAPLAIRVGFGFSGGLLIELVQPLDGDRSVFSEALERRGPGYHHVMFREAFDSVCARMEAAGRVRALESVTPFGERCALFDLEDETGGFVEAMDLHISFGRLTEAMAAAHEGWDGAEPERPLSDLFAVIAGGQA